MCEIIQNGETKLINQGTDVTIVTSSDKADDVMKASKVQVVRGISTAIIQVLNTNYLDDSMILDYGEKTGALVFVDKEIYNIIKKKIDSTSVQLNYIEDASFENIIQITSQTLKERIEKGIIKNSIHYVR